MDIIAASAWTPDTPEETYISSAIGPLEVDNADKPWSFSSPDNNTMRFEVRHGDVFSSSYWTDPATSERDNVQELTENKHPVTDTAQISYQFEVEPGAANTASWLVLGSLKGFYSEDWSAPFEVVLRGEKLAITANYEDTPGHLVYRDIWTSPTNIIRGKWYNINISFKWGPSGDGHLDVSLDGQPVVNYTGNVGYYDQTAYLWKTGIYRSSAPETIAVDVKNLQMTTTDTSSSSVAPIPIISSASMNNGLDSIKGTVNDSGVRSVAIYDGTKLISTAPVTNGAWSFSGNLGSSSVHTLTVAATGAAGNTDKSSGYAVFGSSGANMITSGGGNDFLFGGPGAARDTFAFHAGFGKDVIGDFHPGEDIIQFDRGLFASANAVLSHTANDGLGNAVITYSGSDAITLLGVTKSQLMAHQSDFHFV